MSITTRAQRQQRRTEALKLLTDGVPPTDAATRLTVKWGCSRRTSLRDVELAQGELAKALDSVELQQMVGWLATQYQRLAAKAERDGQYASAVGALNALRAMIVQPQIPQRHNVVPKLLRHQIAVDPVGRAFRLWRRRPFFGFGSVGNRHCADRAMPVA